MDNDKTHQPKPQNTIAEFFNSKIFRIIFFSLVGFIAVLLIFKIGMIAGYKKADFSRTWTENYHMNFGGPRGGFFHDFDDRNFMPAHGIAGQVIKIENPVIIIKGLDNVEKIIKAADDTIISRLRDTIKISDIKIDEFIVVIGESNKDGQIEAKFIRVMPMPPTGMMFNKKFPPMHRYY